MNRVQPESTRHSGPPASPARRAPPRTGGGASRRWLTAAVLAVTAQGHAVAQPQPTLPRVELQAGIHLIKAELAADNPSRMRGLMFRERLGPNQGMLFVFQEKSQQCFWMRNTLIPLSIAFIDDDGSIVNIADMQPRSEDSHCSAKPIRYALEMEQGWFGKRALKAGSRIAGPKGMFSTP